MVKRTNKTVANAIEKLPENEALTANKDISRLFSSGNSVSSNDDLIISLSDAYENKRARQVFEWEKVRRQNIQRAAWENHLRITI